MLFLFERYLVLNYPITLRNIDELITINLGLNLNEIVFYGDFSILSDKLFKNKIQIKIEKTDECIISSIN